MHFDRGAKHILNDKNRDFSKKQKIIIRFSFVNWYQKLKKMKKTTFYQLSHKHKNYQDSFYEWNSFCFISKTRVFENPWREIG